MTYQLVNKKTNKQTNFFKSVLKVKSNFSRGAKTERVGRNWSFNGKYCWPWFLSQWRVFIANIFYCWNFWILKQFNAHVLPQVWGFSKSLGAKNICYLDYWLAILSKGASKTCLPPCPHIPKAAALISWKHFCYAAPSPTLILLTSFRHST